MSLEHALNGSKVVIATDIASVYSRGLSEVCPSKILSVAFFSGIG